MFRFLHIADTHLETPFGGKPETRDRLRRATLEAFSRAVELCIEQRLDALLIAGDLFDDPLLSLKVELFLMRELRRLLEAGTSVFICAGNHDPGASGKRLSKIELERMAGKQQGTCAELHLFTERKPRAVVVKNRDAEEVGVVVGAGHPTERESENLVANFTRLETQLPVVALVHTQVESANAAERHDRYAPSSPRDFQHQDYTYWALGHVHLRGQAVPDQAAWYSGNLQGRNPRESGAKGGLLLSVRAGEPATPEFVPLAPVRWELKEIEGLGERSLETLAERLAAELDALSGSIEEELLVRLELKGEAPLASLLREASTRSELERELEARTGLLEVQLRLDGLHTPQDKERLRRSPSVLAKALQLLAVARADSDLRSELAPAELPGLIRARAAGGTQAASERDTYLVSLFDELEAELLERALAKPSEPSDDGEPE